MNINEKIQLALNKMGIEWCPAMYAKTQRPNEIIVRFENTGNFPCMLQAVEDTFTMLDSGMVEKTVSFYLFDIIEATDNDILNEIIPTYERLEALVWEFEKRLNNYVQCKIVGQLTKAHHSGFVLPDAGIDFNMLITHTKC